MKRDTGKQRGADTPSPTSGRPGNRGSFAIASLAALVPCVVTPLQSYLGNATAFGFGAWPLVRELALLWLVGTFLVWVFLRATERWLGFLPRALVLAGAFYAYLETGILTAGAPPLDGETEFWSNAARGAFDTVVLAVLLVVAVAFRRFLGRNALLATGVVALLSASSLLDIKGETVQTVDSLDDNPFSEGVADRDEVIRRAFFSTNANVIVFILDAMADEVFSDVLGKEPEIAAPFDGFRVFRNHVGMYPSTHFGVAGLMTGQRYDNRVSFGRYVESAFSAESALFPYLSADVPMFVQLGSFKRFGFTNRLRKTRKTGAARNPPCLFRRIDGEQEWTLAQLTFFRLVPFACKHSALRFVMWRWELNRSKSAKATDNERTLFPQLAKAHVDTDEPLTLHVYHTRGCHVPFTTDRNGRTRPPSVDYPGSYEKTCFVLKKLGALLQALKRKKVYDASLIVITADHGNSVPGCKKRFGVDMVKNKAFNRAFPCLAIKAPGAHGSLRDVSTPTTHEHFPELLTAALDGNLSESDMEDILAASGDRVFTDSITHRPGNVWMKWIFHENGTVSQETFDPRGDPSDLPAIPVGKTLSFKALNQNFGNEIPPVVCSGLRDGLVQGPGFKAGKASLSMKVGDPDATYDVTLGVEIVNPSNADEVLSFENGTSLSLRTDDKKPVVVARVPGVADTVRLAGLKASPDGVLVVSAEKQGAKSDVFFVSIRIDKH